MVLRVRRVEVVVIVVVVELATLVDCRVVEGGFIEGAFTEGGFTEGGFTEGTRTVDGGFFRTTPSKDSFAFALPFKLVVSLGASRWILAEGLGTSPRASRFRLPCAAGSRRELAAAVVFARVAIVDAVARGTTVAFASDVEGTMELGFARVVVLSLVFTAFSLLFMIGGRVVRVVRRTYTKMSVKRREYEGGTDGKL